MKDIEKAIDYFYKKMETGNIQSDEQQACYELAIKALEKQLNSGWIPVSERLPDIKDTWQYTNGVKKLVTVQKDYLTYTRQAKYKNDRWEIEFGRDITQYVIAWAELPKPYIQPYKEGNDGKN